MAHLHFGHSNPFMSHNILIKVFVESVKSPVKYLM